MVALIEPIVEGLGYECVGIEYNPHPQHGMLRIYIDSENGILLDDCTKVSHQLSGMLDVEDPIQGEYQLEISSPGEDRPFFKLSQFERFIGSTVTINEWSLLAIVNTICGALVGLPWWSGSHDGPRPPRPPRAAAVHRGASHGAASGEP